jgi:hypothetical protein
MVHVFVIIIILKAFNLMILTTFTCERKRKPNKKNINISNEGLLNLTPYNVIIYKGCAYGITISKFFND